ncbi:fatty acid synthase beta subunit dehydratase [Ascobolus immersus RN42]|uniref:Fatty acid synthase subunit beta n=1 Tax=Ascobolus immersus RN42 TaxID=1160509 RepID=A0A3N4I6V3_ASCIM|nr:fatty acid synthase beta subunit dehydratase [Ascobolus immersus RN42]
MDLRNVNVAYEGFEYPLSVPASLHSVVVDLRDSFSASIHDGIESGTLEKPEALFDVLASFLYFTSSGSSKAFHGNEKALLGAARFLLQELETKYLSDGNDIHVFVAGLATTTKRHLYLLRCYYHALTFVGQSIDGSLSSLLQASQTGKTRLYAIFGGQGNVEDYFSELKELHYTYGEHLMPFIKSASNLLSQLSRNESARKLYVKGLEVEKWLLGRELPDKSYLISAPVSLPLIGLIQLCHYFISCKCLGVEPSAMTSTLSGCTGHSQGIVVAAAISLASDWDSFQSVALEALTVLFWIGVRSQQTYPRTSLPPTVLEDSLEAGEGVPTPMLSIKGLYEEDVRAHLESTNRHLPVDRKVHVALINGPKNIVVAGPPMSLYGLNVSLRKIKAVAGVQENRVPYSKRKQVFTNKFLPITAPFHSPYLEGSLEAIQADLSELRLFKKENLHLPVYHTESGTDIRTIESEKSLAVELAQMIVQCPVNWDRCSDFSGATHILDFGPGGPVGIGFLTHSIRQGRGVRIVLAGSVDGGNSELGFKSELLDRRGSVRFASNWVIDHGPKLVRTKSGKVVVDTKFSRLIGNPPVMVAGMTPCTVPWDFVSTIMRSGYHVELAGGGYHNERGFSESIRKIQNAVDPGCGITINLIYVNPKAMSWQIPLIRRLRKEGAPIEGLTIGAGVPSLDVANEYIRTLGIRHIAFKPGSAESIEQVVEIAKANPKFPVICQWTGGRGGGHHSFEDFHQPILQMYARLRSCSNIILLAGSGFGDASDSYPYLTGKWAQKFRYPPMPFDGVLLGSRLMVAVEAHTSDEAKLAIVKASGVSDEGWENTYTKPTGGIISVLSEMGEPIHKLATRGVLFWAEMDQKIFSLDKKRRLLELEKNRDYIITRLNKDFQKTWFGRNSKGQAVDLPDMTYFEVVERLFELMFIKSESRWIDPSLREMTGLFIRRIEERFIKGSSEHAVMEDTGLLDRPTEALDRLSECYWECREQLVAAQDVQYFIYLCRRPSQKPVPFIPRLDEDFEYWFKKDSLWQSEDLAAVVDQDVERTCILQGPVAVRYSTRMDETAKEILDGIHDGHVKRLLEEEYHNDESTIPVIEYLGHTTSAPIVSIPEALAQYPDIDFMQTETCAQFRISTHASLLPESDVWLQLLAGEEFCWRHAFFSTEVFVQGRSFQTNPMRRIFSPFPGQLVTIENPLDPASTVVKMAEVDIQGNECDLFEARIDGDVIAASLYNTMRDCSAAQGLVLLFNYRPQFGYAPIHEVMNGRNTRIKEFYYNLWFGEGNPPFSSRLEEDFEASKVQIKAADIADFVHAVGNNGEAFVDRPGKTVYAPMDFAIVAGWKAIIKPIFPSYADGDLLKLVHLSNSFRMLPGATPLRKDDILETRATANAIVNEEAGKMVEVRGLLFRDGAAVMEVVSRFLYRGTYDDYEHTFRKVVEKPMQVQLAKAKDVSVLRSKPWFILDDQALDLEGKTLIFRLTSSVRYKNRDIYESVSTEGPVLTELATKEIIQVAYVRYQSGPSSGNPVLEYLRRQGSEIEQPVTFEVPIPLNSDADLTIKAPASNSIYARVSGDLNPIHVSRVFSAYANLPGTITHGMFTSAAVRSLVEVWAANNDSSRVRSFSCNFVGMVLPNDNIHVKLLHVGMVNGRKIIQVVASNDNGEQVLAGEAEVEQPLSAYVFTGQGSQEQGMGMDLYDSSPVARSVWDRADKHFLDNYGFAITYIVRNNPKELTVHFGGPRGKAIRQNYMSMTFETVGADGSVKSERIFKHIDESTESYTYKSPNGLLSATQFTQPALTLMEKASFEDLKAKGLIQRESLFAGHSLGEYSALAALADVMPIESLVSVVFYRGLTMQVAVERDASGNSNYGMCAVNPSRVSKNFTETALKFVVESISNRTAWLLEVVNYNIADQQYVCAGDLRALDTLTTVLNYLKIQSIDIVNLQKTLSLTEMADSLGKIIDKAADGSAKKGFPLVLERGYATIPLPGIDVPFHSTFLRSGVKPFRNFLLKKVMKSTIDPAKLIGKYIPNVTARPFQISKEYFQDVYRLTKSPRIATVLENVRFPPGSV